MSPEIRSREKELEAVRATYREYARSGRVGLWDASNTGFARALSDQRAELAVHLNASTSASSRVLDVGCGDGSVASIASPQKMTWFGVDLRPDALAVASEAYPWAQFIASAADDLPFPDGWFDAALAVVLFSSLPSRTMEADVAAEIGRVLKPGGWLIWYDLRYDNPANPAVHGLSRARLRELFPGWQAELRTLTLLPPLARRLGRLTRVAYPVLHALPVLRSHLVGRLRRPG